MKFAIQLAGAAAALAAFGACTAWSTPADAPMGYLSAAQLPDSIALLGPPPRDGNGAKAGDVATFMATRKLEAGPRWSTAVDDAEFGAAPMMRVFSCAMGLNLDPQTAPALFHLFGRILVDAEAVGGKAKAAYRRPRPFVERGGDICVPAEDWLKNSYSYPSGHATFSWTAGLVLAQVAPERATPILARARSYGESRVVCGVHYPSDIQAGRTLASAVFTVLQSSPAYRADVEQAKAEIATLRATQTDTPTPISCRREDKAATTPVW
jgi:acid phosphatase (class A)